MLISTDEIRAFRAFRLYRRHFHPQADQKPNGINTNLTDETEYSTLFVCMGTRLKWLADQKAISMITNQTDETGYPAFFVCKVLTRGQFQTRKQSAWPQIKQTKPVILCHSSVRLMIPTCSRPEISLNFPHVFWLSKKQRIFYSVGRHY